LRIGAKPGDVLKITGGTVAVGRAEVSDDAHEGMIQIDGTCAAIAARDCRSKSPLRPSRRKQPVAVRFTPMWVELRRRRLRQTGCLRIW